jgi:hypothetical protein
VLAGDEPPSANLYVVQIPASHLIGRRQGTAASAVTCVAAALSGCAAGCGLRLDDGEVSMKQPLHMAGSETGIRGLAIGRTWSNTLL